MTIAFNLRYAPLQIEEEKQLDVIHSSSIRSALVSARGNDPAEEVRGPFMST